jgi:phospho-N-acetylmuramoyl-pentapeptide-transferase
MRTLPLSLGLLVVSCVITIAAGYPFIRALRRYGVGKKIRIDGPTTHEQKMGTPTMGGLLICACVLVVTAVVSLTVHQSAGRSILVPLFVLLTCAFLGSVDDLLTLVGQKGEGLSVRAKLGLLTLIALASGLSIWLPPGINWLPTGLDRDVIFVPTVAVGVHLGFLFVPLAVLAIVGTANAVNLTDGLDSLAATSAAWSFFAYGIIALRQDQAFLVSFCFTVAGALLGFLWFNAHPALVFMGDTGSLALGAALAVVALMTGHIVLLPLIGIVFVAEALSVILQVGYFKLSGGKRLFRMAPLHHHFEILGWSETHVTQRFWLVSMLAAIAGVALAII